MDTFKLKNETSEYLLSLFEEFPIISFSICFALLLKLIVMAIRSTMSTQGTAEPRKPNHRITNTEKLQHKFEVFIFTRLLLIINNSNINIDSMLLPLLCTMKCLQKLSLKYVDGM